jgi:hypothetical protein
MSAVPDEIATAPPEVTSLWNHLPEASQDALIEVIRLLAIERWSGDIILNCSGGGVRDWHENRRRTPRS